MSKGGSRTVFYVRCLCDALDIMLSSNSDALSVDSGHDSFECEGEEGEVILGTDILLLIYLQYKIQTPAGIKGVPAKMSREINLAGSRFVI